MRTAVLAALFTTATLSVADAHIHILYPPARQTDPQGDPQKTQNCGSTTLLRDPARVTTLAPGATITLMFAETINHPGWFRVSFQPDGDAHRIPPASNGPAGNGTASNYPTEDLTGMLDPGPTLTGSTILKDRIPDLPNGGMSTVEITLPNIECTNCTLQFIEVMTNNPPYDITATTNNDLYFNCADLVLAANAPDAGVFVAPDAPMDPEDFPHRGVETGGCSATGSGGSSWLVALGLAGVIVRRRRRRS